MIDTYERKLTPFETESGMRLLDSLEIGGVIPHYLIAGGNGGYFPCGTPDWMITSENEITFKRSQDYTQRFSSITELEAMIRWGCPWQSFDIRRTGEHSYEMLNYKSVAPLSALSFSGDTQPNCPRSTSKNILKNC